MSQTNLLMPLFNRVGRGGYWRALGFAEALTQHHGYDVTILAVAPNRKWGFHQRQHNGVTIIETPDLMPASGYDPWDTLARLHWLRGKSFHLIHAFECRPVVWAPTFYLQKRHHIPVVMDWCDWFGRGGSVEERPQTLATHLLRPVETFFEERFRHWPQATTVINTPLAKKAMALGVTAEQILHLPNGANVAEIIPQNKKEVRQRLGLPLDAPIISYTGAIFRRDAQLMADTFNLIHAQRPDVRLLIIGYCNVDIAALVNEPTAVIQTGPVSYPDLAAYIAAVDIGWLPLCNSGANQGRFPMKVNDFMSAAVPIVVSDVGDLGDVVRQYNLGRVAGDTPEAQAETVLNFLEETAVLPQIGQHARHIAETVFAWPVVTQTLAEFYQKVIDN